MTASSPPPGSADALTRCVAFARSFLWISSALGLLAGALYYAWFQRSKNRGRDQSPHARLRCALLWLVGALVGGWGAMGVALRTSSRCRDPNEKSALVMLSTVVASACLLVSVALLTSAIFASLRAMPPGRETPPALVCLRCSCCSRVFKRLLLLAPALLLAAVNLVSWNDSRHPLSEVSASCGKSNAPAFFGGAAAIFLAMVLVQLLSYGFNSSQPFCQRRCNSSSTSAGLPYQTNIATGISPVVDSAPRVSRTAQRQIVFATLLLLSLACIAWAVLGWLWMAHSQSSLPDSDSECPPTARSMGASIALLFLIGWSLLTLTLCCRLEGVVLASSDIPTVDVSLLSPTLLRSPKAALSPPNGELLQASATAASSSDAVV